MGTCEVGLESGAPQAVNCFLIQALGDLTLAQPCARPSVNPERPIAVGALRVLAKSHESALCDLGVLGSRRSLDQLAQRPHGDEQLRNGLAALDGRRERLLVATEAVHENGFCPLSVLNANA